MQSSDISALEAKWQSEALLDAAFSIFSYYYREITEVTAYVIVTLQKLFPEISVNTLIDAGHRARNLYFSVINYTDYHVFYSIAPPVEELIENDHPGFSQKSYSAVLIRAQYMATK
jgi:hypothetical protein